MKTKIVIIDPDEIKGNKNSRKHIQAAAALLRAGRLVAFPTETVYGLGADAGNEDAIRRVYEVKNRPPDNPLILHIHDFEQLNNLAGDVCETAMALARRFWPGPLTMVFKKRETLPDYATAGLDTVAVRMPSHRVARELLKAAGAPVAAPSANLSGKPSPTSGAHVVTDLSDKVDMIIDSGPVELGLESTVLDATRLPFAILRPGGITYEMITETIGQKNVICYPPAGPTSVNPAPESLSAANLAAANRSPGVRHRHYAPEAPMLLLKGSQKNKAIWLKLFVAAGCGNGRSLAGLLASDELLSVPDVRALEGVSRLSLGGTDDEAAAAGVFYDALRKFDKAAVDRIYCEFYRSGGLGTALADRMTRAAGGNILDADTPSVLFVCTGNTCRSAMAEAIFNAEIQKSSAADSVAMTPFAISAGLYAADGDTAAEEAVEQLKKYGIELSAHRTRPLDAILAERAGLILTMTGAHKAELLRRYPEFGVRVYTVSEFIRNRPGDISDPYGLGPREYEKCAEELRELAMSFIASLMRAG